MNIVVLAGGLSPERDVSLSSGALISNALIDNGHKVFLLDLALGYNEEVNRDLFNTTKYPAFNVKETPGLIDSKDSIGPNVLEICQMADIVFMALHGDIGENGELQEIFEKNNIKFTGTNSVGSKLAMNKIASKELMIKNSIKTPKQFTLDNPEFPCVVKPNSGGSSIGTHIVETKEAFNESILAASKYGNTLLIEEYIQGREFAVAILGNKALPVIEIIPPDGWYDYYKKYQAGAAIEECPANISETLTNKLQNIAIKVHNILGLGYYSRVDFLVDKDNNIYCLEANTLPGMTPTSLLPQEAAARGISFNHLCECIINEVEI